MALTMYKIGVCIFSIYAYMLPESGSNIFCKILSSLAVGLIWPVIFVKATYKVLFKKKGE